MRCLGSTLTSVLALLAVHFCPTIDAATIAVPADQLTIQDAIDVAVAGDIVEIAPGTYFENITTAGKAITVRGAGIDVTIIDGSALTAGPESGSVVRVENGEQADTILEDLTLTGGIGSLRMIENFLGEFGGGLYVDGASPTLRRLKMAGNTCVGLGAGAWIRTPPIPEYAVRECQFVENTDGTGTGVTSLGADAITLEDCVVARNTANTDGPGAHLYANEITARRCLFEENSHIQATSIGGGLLILRPSFISGPPVSLARVEDCIFRGNIVSAAGGGIIMLGATLEVTDTLFEANESAIASAIATDGTALTIRRCAFRGNDAAGTSIALSINPGGSLDIDQSTFANEQAGAGLIAPQQHLVVMRNSIVWGSQTPLIDGAATTPPPDVAYCLIEGGFAGTGNIDADPLFVDAASGDLRLSPLSPCIDAGDPTAPLDLDGTVTDMGAFPFLGAFFRRGDVNLDSTIDVADPLAILADFFFGGAPIECVSAADTNDDGLYDLADPIYLLNYLFQEGPEPPAPLECGFDPTPDTSCEAENTGC